MNPMLRSVVGVVTGVLLAAIVLALIQVASLIMYPLPEGLDHNDPNAFAAYMAGLPMGAFIIVLVSWFVGPLVGGSVSGFIAGRSEMLHAVPIAVLFLLASVYNMATLPHPMWFWAPGLLASPLGAWLGAALVARMRLSRQTSGAALV